MTDKHKQLLDQTEKLYNIIQEGLEIDLSVTSTKNILDLKETEEDVKTLTQRMLLLNKLLQYSAVIFGHSVELQKTYKTPELYGLKEGLDRANSAIKLEIETLRSILSNLKEQIRIR